MPNPNKTYTINFNVQLDDETDRMLIAIATDLQHSKAQVCRAAIRRTWRMKFARQPSCADGQDCRCPHAHIYAPTQPPPKNPNAPV